MNILSLVLISLASFADVENIHYNGVVKTKIYVTAVMNGKKFPVPVINGYLPRVTTAISPNGEIKKDFHYDGTLIHNGDLVVNYRDTTRSPEGLLRKKDEEIKILSKKIEELQKKILTDDETPVVSDIYEPVKIPIGMKRPSEILGSRR